MRRFGLAVAVLGLLAGLGGRAGAVLIIHTPADRVPPVVVSPAFGPLAAGGAAGTNYIDFGVDYSFGGVEGVFNDPPLAFGGVNSSGNVDLLTPVDGRIVLTGTTTQGLTSFVSVMAGNAAAGSLLLEVFSIGGTLLGSATNPTNDTSTFSVNRSGVFDIASFRVSTTNFDSFGVRQVSLETPVAVVTAVPEPSTLISGGIAGLIGLGYGWRRRKAKSAA